MVFIRQANAALKVSVWLINQRVHQVFSAPCCLVGETKSKFCCHGTEVSLWLISLFIHTFSPPMKTLYVLYIKTTKGNILSVEVRGHTCFSTWLKSLFCSGNVLWTNRDSEKHFKLCVKHIVILAYSLFIAAGNWAAWTQLKSVHVIYYVWQVFPGLHLVPF